MPRHAAACRGMPQNPHQQEAKSEAAACRGMPLPLVLACGPSKVSHDTTQSLWDPIVGSRGHPGSGKIQLFPKSKFSPFPSQICPTKHARRRAQRFFATPKPACGGPCGQTRARMPPTVSQDTTGSVWDSTLGSLGHPGSGKIKKIAIFAHFRGPEKKPVPATLGGLKIALKVKFRQNEAVSSKLSSVEPLGNLL